MANAVSSLHEVIKPGRYNVSGNDEAAVIAREIAAFTLIQVAAWPETLASVGRVAAKAAGTSKAPGPRKSLAGKTVRLLRVEPLKWWLLAEAEQALPLPGIQQKNGTVLDLSHSRCWVQFEGESATDLLNRFLPLDLREASFPDGDVANSVMHHADVTLWRDKEIYNLLLPRGFSVSLWELLEESAKQFGLEVQ